MYNYNTFKNNIDEIRLEDRFVINTINQYSFILAEKDLLFKEALVNSDILLADGVGITFAELFLNGQKIKKIAGSDVHTHLLKQVELKKGKVFYIGSTTNTMLRVTNRITDEYPGIKHVGFICPPFADEMDLATTESIIEKVNKFAPDLLVVAMSAPKQEKWVFVNEHRLNTTTICCIGAAVDFFAHYNRPNKIFINIGIEWLIRLCREPNRLAKRYVIGGPIFIAKIIKFKFRKKLRAKT